MCIIVAKPEKIKLPLTILENMWNNNPHGAGFMWAEDNNLFIKKGFMNFHHLAEHYYPLEKKKLVLHFRWRSTGAISAEMTHPFVINENVAMVHNGTIPKLKTQNFSDTFIFSKYFGEKVKDPMLALESARFINRLNSIIGYSKLAFMDNKGKIKIVNPQMGLIYNNCWFSNRSFFEKEWYEKNLENEDYDYTKWKESNFIKEI
jgi:predicted glutamine amidotransferase